MVDINVGRLAKWLRAMGHDTIFPKENGDNELVRIALRENRVLVTSDAWIGLRRVGPRRPRRTGRMEKKLLFSFRGVQKTFQKAF